MSNMLRNIPSDLQESEIQDIIDIADELTRNNKIIQLDLFYKIAKRRLKIDNKKLILAINYLLKEKILVEGSKLLKKDVLLNKYREKIYNFIKFSPGVHFSTIKRHIFSDSPNDKSINVGSTGQFIWHLEVLLKFNFVKSTSIKNYTLFLPAEIDEELGKYYFLIREKINRKIVEIISHNEPVEQAKIPTRINESKGSVYYHINLLEEFGIVNTEVNEISNLKEVKLNPDKRELFIKIMNEIPIQ